MAMEIADRVLRSAGAFGLLTSMVVLAHAQGVGIPAAESCGPIYRAGAYGPYDYRTDKGKLEIVEKHHFTTQVEQLLRGQEGYLGGDLDYTLRAFPNHHRALVAIVRFGEREKSPQPPFLAYSIDCYFERAIRFKADDTVVRALFAQYLRKTGRNAEAASQLEAATFYAGDNAISHYNIGLIFFELGQYDRALQQAHQARKLGVERRELEELLKRAGKWQDAPP